jgi:hypothetical protein
MPWAITVAVILLIPIRVLKTAVLAVILTIASIMMRYWKNWERSLNNSKQLKFNVLKG